MFDNKSILAIIGARRDSKGLPNKNIRPFAGRPMIEWTIQAGIDSSYIDRLIVSTDCQEIATIADAAGAEVPFLRPKELATDNAALEEALIHCINWLKGEQTYDYVMLLQPTSPLRDAKHIDQAIDYYFAQRNSDRDTLISAKAVSKKMGWLMQVNDAGYIDFCLEQQGSYPQRQNNRNYYLPNGAIYLSPAQVLADYFFHSPNTLYFLMEDDVSIDIDSLEEFLLAEKLHKQTLENMRKT